jgi:ATP/maltotriose-dependent transcriptional regulator MalT
MCHVIAAMAEVGLNEADAALDFVQRARSANSQTDSLGHVLAEISALRAHVMKHNATDIRHSAHRLVQLSTNLREQTWKAVALATCAEAAVETGEQKLAQQYSGAAMQLVEGAKLPIANWRVEAVAAEVAEKSHSGRATGISAAQLREKSIRSRQELYNSLGVEDPLRQFAKADAPVLQVMMTALGEN